MALAAQSKIKTKVRLASKVPSATAFESFLPRGVALDLHVEPRDLRILDTYFLIYLHLVNYDKYDP